MKKALILEHLELAERHVLLGEAHLTRQRTLIVELERDGHFFACDMARQLLTALEDSQALHLATRNRLLHESA